jgi:aminoglycoside phosphotransferase family enzyme
VGPSINFPVSGVGCPRVSSRTETRESPANAIDAKVEALKQTETYPERPARIETIETHMSWVFLTDLHAYKLKKPVRYEFLDFSTIAARRHDCEEEVRLNRRLAPDVYLDVVPLTALPDGGMRIGGEGVAVDWLVKMRRLLADRTLQEAIRSGTWTEDGVRRVAALLSHFYVGARRIEVGFAEYRERFARDIRGNLAELEMLAHRLPAEQVQRVHAAQLDFLERRKDLFDTRVRERRIVEAHGDLRPEHVHLGPEPLITDCLEFNLQFRTLDPADELAFLAMECDRLGAPSIALLLFETYQEIASDRPPETLVQFYKGVRACLRAKLALWHLREPVVREPQKWRALAADYLRLADDYAHRLD